MNVYRQTRMIYEGRWKPTGLLPVAGGLLDQSATYYQAVNYVDNIVSESLISQAQDRS